MHDRLALIAYASNHSVSSLANRILSQWVRQEIQSNPAARTVVDQAGLASELGLESAALKPPRNARPQPPESGGVLTILTEPGLRDRLQVLSAAERRTTSSLANAILTEWVRHEIGANEAVRQIVEAAALSTDLPAEPIRLSLSQFRLQPAPATSGV